MLLRTSRRSDGLRFRRWSELALRLALAAVFLTAASGKWAHPTDFVEQVANYQLLPELAPWAAVIVPSLEVVASLILAFAPSAWRQAAALVIGGMLIVFSVAIARAWALGIDSECGCFGAGGSTIGPWSLLRNAGLFTIAAILVIVNHPRPTAVAART